MYVVIANRTPNFQIRNKFYLKILFLKIIFRKRSVEGGYLLPGVSSVNCKIETHVLQGNINTVRLSKMEIHTDYSCYGIYSMNIL
jgi:hypothetical protein